MRGLQHYAAGTVRCDYGGWIVVTPDMLRDRWKRRTLRQRFLYWIEERQWLRTVKAARRARGDMLFSSRLTFDKEFAPRIGNGRIGYPDAFYFAKPIDYNRALVSSLTERSERDVKIVATYCVYKDREDGCVYPRCPSGCAGRREARKYNLTAELTNEDFGKGSYLQT